LPSRGSPTTRLDADNPGGARLAFTDQDTNDTHTVTGRRLIRPRGPTPPAATQADLAAALTTTLQRFRRGNRHREQSTGISRSPDKDLDYLAANETLTVNYNIKVADRFRPARTQNRLPPSSPGANDAGRRSRGGPEAASLAEQARA